MLNSEGCFYFLCTRFASRVNQKMIDLTDSIQEAKTSDCILSRKYEAAPNQRDIYQQKSLEEKWMSPACKTILNFWSHYDVLIIAS